MTTPSQGQEYEPTDRAQEGRGTEQGGEPEGRTFQVEPFPGASSGATGGDDSQEQRKTCSGCVEDYHGVPGTATWTGKGGETGGEAATEEGGETGGAAGTESESRGAGATKGIKGFVSTVHGASEAFRGSLMQGVDQMFGHEEGVEKHQKIAQAGVEKMRAGRGSETGTGSGG